jgi:bifunctional DNA-binding transcriptional regulator/antitoxin component of YhaV-PrlF toxin-antitoxin module
VTIPQPIRDACGIEPGSEIFFTKTAADTFACHVLPARRSILEVMEEYTVDGVAPDLDALREGMGDEITRRYLESPDTPEDVSA